LKEKIIAALQLPELSMSSEKIGEVADMGILDDPLAAHGLNTATSIRLATAVRRLPSVAPP